MQFVVYDYSNRTRCVLTKHPFDAQSRDSRESLRPSTALEMNVGMRRRGEFRAIGPTTHTHTIPTTVELRVEFGRAPSFSNIAGGIGSDYILYSLRRQGGRSNWIRPNRGPPCGEYWTMEGLSTNHTLWRYIIEGGNRARGEEPSESANQAGPPRQSRRRDSVGVR